MFYRVRITWANGSNDDLSGIDYLNPPGNWVKEPGQAHKFTELTDAQVSQTFWAYCCDQLYPGSLVEVLRYNGDSDTTGTVVMP